MERTCKKCGETKPIEEFAKGVNINSCKLCYHIYLKKYRDLHREKILQSQRKYDQLHRDERSAKSRKYWKENKEMCKSKENKYRLNHKAQIRIRHRKYRLQHKENIINTRNKHKENMTDSYISMCLKLKVPELKQHPELIELKRIQLKIFRLTKKEKV